MQMNRLFYVSGNVNVWNNKNAEITGFTKDEAFDKPLGKLIILTILQRELVSFMSGLWCYIFPHL